MKLRFILILSVIMHMMACNRSGNKLVVKVSSPLNSADINISMEVLASVPKTVVFDGMEKRKIPDGYGENEWFFTYKDTLHAYLRHIKINRNDKHIYRFTFYQEDGKYFLKANIEGDSPLQKVIELVAK